MALKYLPGTFNGATANASWNLRDIAVLPSTALPYSSIRSPGVTITQDSGYQPGVSEKWSVLGVSFQAGLSLNVNPGAAPAFGLLGKLIAGLLVDDPVPVTNYQSPLLSLPSDTSMYTTMWDGSVDSTPPSALVIPTPTAQTLNVSGTVSLPIARDLNPGQQVSVGMWLEPSLAGTQTTFLTVLTLQVSNGKFSMVIDDGT